MKHQLILINHVRTDLETYNLHNAHKLICYVISQAFNTQISTIQIGLGNKFSNVIDPMMLLPKSKYLLDFVDFCEKTKGNGEIVSLNTLYRPEGMIIEYVNYSTSVSYDGGNHYDSLGDLIAKGAENNLHEFANKNTDLVNIIMQTPLGLYQLAMGDVPCLRRMWHIMFGLRKCSLELRDCFREGYLNASRYGAFWIDSMITDVQTIRNKIASLKTPLDQKCLFYPGAPVDIFNAFPLLEPIEIEDHNVYFIKQWLSEVQVCLRHEVPLGRAYIPLTLGKNLIVEYLLHLFQSEVSEYGIVGCTPTLKGRKILTRLAEEVGLFGGPEVKAFSEKSKSPESFEEQSGAKSVSNTLEFTICLGTPMLLKDAEASILRMFPTCISMDAKTSGPCRLINLVVASEFKGKMF